MTETEPVALEDTGPAARSAVTFLRWIGGTFAVLAAINLGLSLRFGPIGGDLARLGGFAERDYAPEMPQPAPRIAPNTVALEDADVVVLGDSFSNHLVWQGELEALTGRRTLTFQYGEAGCISNWLQWMHSQRLKPGALIVVETVERSFVARFSQLTTCPQVTPLPMRRHLAVDTRSWMDSGLSLDIVYQSRVLVNTLRLGTRTSYRAGETVNAALKRSDRFTARRADRLLYHADDETKDGWRAPQVAAALSRLAQEQAAFKAAGQQFQVLVIPDKSSVYREDLVEPRMRPATLTQDLQQAGLSPVDTRACFRRLATSMPDFYLPDDMHVGVVADRLLARQIAQGRCAEPATANTVN